MAFQYIAFHKPYGVLSQFTPEGGHDGLQRFGFPKDVYAAGRLDHDSEGLLLLTDDGGLVKRLLDPKFGHPRSYAVQVEGIPSEEDLKKLSEGVLIKEYRTKPCLVERIETPAFKERIPPIRFRKNKPTSWLHLTLTEGKNRQVRRMTAAIGFPTLRLIRLSIGNIVLEGLDEGEWKPIEKKEIIASSFDEVQNKAKRMQSRP